MYLLFQGKDSKLWYRLKQKSAAVRYLMGVSDTGKAAEVLFSHREQQYVK